MHHVLNDAEQLACGMLRAELEVWIGWFLDLCNLNVFKLSLLLLTTAGQFLVAGRCFEALAYHKDFEYNKEKS